MGTRAAGECFHSFFEFSQTFTSVATVPELSKRWRQSMENKENISTTSDDSEAENEKSKK